MVWHVEVVYPEGKIYIAGDLEWKYCHEHAPFLEVYGQRAQLCGVEEWVGEGRCCCCVGG